MVIVAGASGVQLGAHYSESGGLLHVVSGGFQYIDLYPHEPSEAAGTSVDADIDLPEDARIQRALFELTARATSATTISSVAEIRATNSVTAGSVACAVDFGRLVTVAGLQVPQFSLVFLSKVFFWTGTAWGSARTGTSFPDVQTERILIESDSDGVDSEGLVAYVTNHVDVKLPITPSGLELQLDGTTVWFERQGSTPTEPPPSAAGGVAYVVDRTDAMRDVFDRALPSGGLKKVRATLRAAVPGALSLTPKPFVLRVHTVQFPPQGLTQTIDVRGEGVIGFDVTPPPTAAEVRGIELKIRGNFGPERVQPPTGPTAEPAAALVLKPGRALLAGLPSGLWSRFAVISGVRLHLAAKSGGGVLAARLLADIGGRPGDVVASGTFSARTVAAGMQSWTTLRLDQPFPAGDLPAAVPTTMGQVSRGPVAAWLEIQLSDGEVECSLTRSMVTDPAAPGAPLLRRLPGGGTSGLTVIEGFEPLNLAIRLVGHPGPSIPLPAVELGVVSGSLPDKPPTAVGIDPGAEDIAVAIPLDPPLPTSDSTVLTAVVNSEGSVTVDTVRVLYAEAGAA